MSHYSKFEEKKKQEYDALKEQREFFDAAMQVQDDNAHYLVDEWGDHELKEPEFDDFYKVLEMGAKKHGAHNWLEPNGSKSSHKNMFESMFRHLAEASVGQTRDHESGLHPLLHLVTRALMVYTRQKRGIRHEDDVEAKPSIDDVLRVLDKTIDSIGHTNTTQESIDALWKGLEGATILLEEMRGDI